MSVPAQNDCVDIIIVGAGLVGTPLACVLAKQGWSVALLDEGNSVNKSPTSNNGLAQRCTALSMGTKQWFDRNGLWQAIHSDACPIEHVFVSHKGYFGSTRLHAKELDADALGYVINNERLAETLLTTLDQTNVLCLSDARVTAVTLDEQQICVEHGNERLCARLLIAADGVSSFIRESVGIGTEQVNYEQAAVLGTLLLDTDHQCSAYERFTDTGPLALLPRPGKYMSFVDCMDSGQMSDIQALSDADYLQRLQTRFGHRLGRFKAVGERFVTPLLRIEATRQVAQRTLLLGNAMRLLHPVGGQGYNLAMRDVAQWQSLLEEGCPALHSKTLDPGQAQLLDRFVKLRATDQRRTVQLTDALARGFRGSSAFPAHIRALGLIGLDTVSPLRKRFARMAMGLAG